MLQIDNSNSFKVGMFLSIFGIVFSIWMILYQIIHIISDEGNKGTFFMLILFVIFLVFCIFRFFVNQKKYLETKAKEDIEKEQIYEERKIKLQEYKDRLKKIGIDNNTRILYIYEQMSGRTESYYCWKDKNIFNLLENISSICRNDVMFLSQDDFIRMQESQVLSIPLSSIKHYQVIGDIRYQMNVSGGGGGGSSLSGAVIGGMIAGGTGAIIGSRKKINEIRSETVKIDDRKIEFVYDDVNGNRQMIECHYKSLPIFEELIPDKEYSIVQEKKRRKLIGDSNSDDDVAINSNAMDEQNILNQVEKLFAMKERGIITEDEFIEKKKELLSKI